MVDASDDELVDFAERPRVDGWTLRSALVRYAQPEPARASAVLELVRRTDGALRGSDDARPVAELLDRVGDILSAWATDVSRPRPDAEVDALGREAFTILADLGVPRETRPPRRS